MYMFFCHVRKMNATNSSGSASHQRSEEEKEINPLWKYVVKVTYKIILELQKVHNDTELKE
ncbi:hypothetical protein LguiA_021780 [Lonicera macranthoides]